MKGDLRNITRLDYERARGWWVRIYRTEDGQTRCISRGFSDGVHGGKNKALAAARKWRDAKLATVRPVIKGGRRGTPVGYGYVRRTDVSRRKTVAPVFIAWLKTDGGPKSTTRSIDVWGVAGAKRECEKWLARERRELRRKRS